MTMLAIVSCSTTLAY